MHKIFPHGHVLEYWRGLLQHYAAQQAFEPAKALRGTSHLLLCDGRKPAPCNVSAVVDGFLAAYDATEPDLSVPVCKPVKRWCRVSQDTYNHRERGYDCSVLPEQGGPA